VLALAKPEVEQAAQQNPWALRWAVAQIPLMALPASAQMAYLLALLVRAQISLCHLA
jgi:hypothetical protein